ncbi:MAG: glycosyltransferase family 4 protein [Pseudomonadota bacterium]
MKVWLPLIATATGSEVYARRLAHGLTARGHDVTFDVVAHRYQYAPWLAPISPPDGTQVTLANTWSAAAFHRRGIPLVSVCHLVVHDPRLTPFKSLAQRIFHAGFIRPLERRAIARATRNIAVSQTVATQMQTHLGAGAVDVVFNGVDTQFFTPGPRQDTTRLRLLFVGKPSLRKGFDTVAKILARLGDSAEFICVGPEPAPGLPRPEGTYTGHRDRAGVRAALQDADLLLFPSRMEGCPYVVLEAMACGLPVVGCTATPVEEIAPEGTGILRAPGDIDGFVRAITALAHDRARLRTMGTKARAHAAQTLSEDAWLDRTEAVLLAAAKTPD